MNKNRQTSHLTNVLSYDLDGNIVLLHTPSGTDNSARIPTTAWVRSYVTGLTYATQSYVSTQLGSYVTLSGQQTITGIKTFSNEQLFGNGITLTGGYITYTSGSYNLTLNTNILTANRNVFLKDGSGTLAFTTDIPSLAGYATEAYVGTAISNLVASSPAALDTLNELAAALGNDASFSTTVSTALGNRLRIDTASQGLNSTQQSNGRTNLGLGTAALSATGDFAAASHTHSIANVTGLQTALDSKQASLGGTGFVKSTSGTISYDTNTYLTTTAAAATYPTLTGGNASGTWNIDISGFANQVSGITAAGSEKNLIYQGIADNDIFRLRVGGASNAGWVELATADDGTEPIYIRQYTGPFTTIARTATILDGSGNTSFPGTVTAPTFSGALSGNASTSTTAGSISGFNNPTASATANTIVYRDGSGDIYGRYLFGSYQNSSDDVNTGNISYIMAKFGDNYHRSATAAKVQSFLGLGSAAYQNTGAFLSSSGSVTVGGYLTVNGAGSSSSIYMSDSDEGNREIHCNSNRIGFLTQAGAWGAWLYDGADWEAASSVRAPIFYDSNDTGYYADFNTTSDTGIRLRGGILMGPNPTWGAYLQVGGNGNNTDYATVVATDGNLHMDSAVGKAMYLNYYHNGTIWLNGSTYSISSNGSYYNGTASYANSAGSASSANSAGYSSLVAIPDWRDTNYQPNQFDGHRVGFHFNNTNALGGNSNFWMAVQTVSPWSSYDPSHRQQQLLWGGSGGLSFRYATGGTSWSGWYRLYSDDYRPYADTAGSLSGFDKTNPSFAAVYANNWFRAYGTTGLYQQDYGGHFARSTDGSYGTWQIWGGARGGYSGLNIIDPSGYWNNLMYENGNGGVYSQNANGWQFYYHRGNNCFAMTTGTTSGSYRAYVGGSLYAEGDIVAYSDARLKRDIVTIDNPIDKVTQMRGVYYTKIGEETKGRQTGVIAQEMNEVLPEVVTYASDIDTYGVSYGNIVGVLIEAIKEQQTQIEDLKKQIEYLVDNK